MKSITLVIPENAATKLAELAQRQYRAPRQQAAAMLVEAIERAASVPTRQMANERREPEPR